MRTATEVAKMLEIDVNGVYALRNRIRRGYRPKPLTILAYRIAFNMPKEQLDFWFKSNAFDSDFILKATKEAENVAKRGVK